MTAVMEGVDLHIEEPYAQEFIALWDHIASRTRANALLHGFPDGETVREKLSDLCLAHSEISEAVEALRNGNPESVKTPGFSQATEELADAVIRIANFARANGLSLPRALIAKHHFNINRPHKHGGKAC